MKMKYFMILEATLKTIFHYAREYPHRKITVRYGNQTIAELSIHEIEDLCLLWQRRAMQEWPVVDENPTASVDDQQDINASTRSE